MSSACQCHIDGAYCFYCEVYSPVAQENERLHVEIEHLRNCIGVLAKESDYYRGLLETTLSELEQAESYSSIVDEVIRTLRKEVVE